MSQIQQLEIFKHAEVSQAPQAALVQRDYMLPVELLTNLKDVRESNDGEIAGCQIFPGGQVDLRHDVFHFVKYVEERGLTRTVRGNDIPKSDARKLARILSYKAELDIVEDCGSGFWSDYVSRAALAAKLVQFNVKGVYQGYTSQTESFPDNDITVRNEAWQAYVNKSPLEKELQLLDALISTTKNEFFHTPTLLTGTAFDTAGSALGPVSHMNVPETRRKLLSLLAKLKPNVWYDFRSLVEVIRMHATGLILDRAYREPDWRSSQKLKEWQQRFASLKNPPPRPELKYEDIYTNFREFPVDYSGTDRKNLGQITSKMSDSFYRVEGRYLEWFLREVPYIAGLVDLAYRPLSDKRGLNVSPPFDRLHAFRLKDRLFQLLRGSADINRVKTTVLPTFEVVVEAPSYPDVVLSILSPWAQMVSQAAPIYRLKLDKKTALATLSQIPNSPDITELLLELTKTALPENVATELSEWSGQADKVTLYTAAGLLEITDSDKRSQILESLAGLILDDRIGPFVVVADPDSAFRRLEKALHVPVRASSRDHAADHEFDSSACDDNDVAMSSSGTSGKEARPKVSIAAVDMVAYRSPDRPFLEELQKYLSGKVEPLWLADSGEALIVPASCLPQVRLAIKHLGKQFDVAL